MRTRRLLGVLCLVAGQVWAADESEMKLVLERLSRLEQQNQALLEELKALRAEIGGKRESASGTVAEAVAAAPVEERVAVAEQRERDLDQEKLSSEHKLPVQLTGMVLFNAFANGRYANGQLYPVVAAATAGRAFDGGSLRQSELGLRFQGPEIFGGGQVKGTLFMDFFGSTGTPLSEYFRLRVATVDLDWKNTTVSVGQDKPLLAPRDPESFAQVGVSPLTGSGNLWLWAPQARVEQRFHFGEQAGLRAQVGVYQTNETSTGVPAEYTSNARAALQGRFEFWRNFSEGRRIEIAPGFDYSRSRVLGQTVPTHVASVDWLVRPFARFDITGQFFEGVNVGTVGGLRQGITVSYGERAQGVHALGGWAQLQFRPTERLTLNAFGGQEDDRNSDLPAGAIAKNQTYGANAIYRLGPNVFSSFEFSELRTSFLGGPTRLNRHYDLSLAYLF